MPGHARHARTRIDQAEDPTSDRRSATRGIARRGRPVPSRARTARWGRVVLVCVLAFAMVGPVRGSTDDSTTCGESADRSSRGEADFAEWKGPCLEANFVVRTDAANVRPMVPPRYRDDILLDAGPPGNELATLALLFIRCPEGMRLTTDHLNSEHQNSDRDRFETPLSHEVSLAVLLDDTDDSDLVFQFYSLANYTDWEPLASSHRALGHPTTLVQRLMFDLRFDPTTGKLVRLEVDLPAPNDRLTMTATAGALNPLEVDAAADEFVIGPRGPLRVAHRAPETKTTPFDVARVTAHNPNGLFARAFGRTTIWTDAGVFFETGNKHRHCLTPWK